MTNCGLFIYLLNKRSPLCLIRGTQRVYNSFSNLGLLLCEWSYTLVCHGWDPDCPPGWFNWDIGLQLSWAWKPALGLIALWPLGHVIMFCFPSGQQWSWFQRGVLYLALLLFVCFLHLFEWIDWYVMKSLSVKAIWRLTWQMVHIRSRIKNNKGWGSDLNKWKQFHAIPWLSVAESGKVLLKPPHHWNHEVFRKLIYGWIEPIVIKTDLQHMESSPSHFFHNGPWLRHKRGNGFALHLCSLWQMLAGSFRTVTIPRSTQTHILPLVTYDSDFALSKFH